MGARCKDMGLVFLYRPDTLQGIALYRGYLGRNLSLTGYFSHYQNRKPKIIQVE